jgi:hypothetical protein
MVDGLWLITGATAWDYALLVEAGSKVGGYGVATSHAAA